MYFVSLFKDLYSNHDCRRGLRNVACMALIILYCCIGCCPRRRIRVAWAAAAIREKETEEEGRRKLTLGADEKAAYPEMGKINRHIWLRIKGLLISFLRVPLLYYCSYPAAKAR